MKQPSDLSREELEDIVLQIRNILWKDSKSGELAPDLSWDSETIERVSGVIQDAGLKPGPVPQEPLPLQDDRWERIFAVPGGHRYFREKATRKVAIADDSGGWPEECDGGPLFVDTRSPLGPDRAWTFAVPLVGGCIAMAGADEAAGLIRHVRMRIEWPSAIREAVAVGASDPAELRAALEAFIRTIEATGGCIRPGRRPPSCPASPPSTSTKLDLSPPGTRSGRTSPTPTSWPAGPWAASPCCGTRTRSSTRSRMPTRPDPRRAGRQVPGSGRAGPGTDRPSPRSRREV